ncbi:MAG: hypothetical protein J7M34_05405 [Anaerolineae bacterium]|nr:hypothetical protein [Anaerolineae bacterium]
MNAAPPLLSPEHILASLNGVNGLPGIIGLLLLTALMLVITDWRFTVLGIGLQSVLLAILATRHSPVEWALLRAVTGGLVAIMWFLSAKSIRWGRRPAQWLRWRWPLLSARTALRATLIVFVAVLLLTHHARLPLRGLDPDLAFLCTWLAITGLLALALSNEILTAGIGLLWWLEAFHLYYSALEHQVVMEGVIGGLKLLIGLACAYLIVAEGQISDTSEEEPL